MSLSASERVPSAVSRRRRSRAALDHNGHVDADGWVNCPSCRSAPPKWQVTGPQKEAGYGKVRRPWGTVHLRREGTQVTACGILAANWYVFWDLDFGPGNPSACAECARAQRVF
jgi:hypothetical protein